MPRKSVEDLTITKGSGNVFADLGFRNPEQESLKANLALEIYKNIKQQGLTQVEAAKILGIQQPHVSRLMRGHSGSFSAERLMRFLNVLGQDIKIISSPTKPSRKVGLISFQAAFGGRVASRR